MRFLCFLTVLTCLEIPTSVLAQDAFDGIPVEPRPAEYIHWDAEAFAEFQNELEAELRDGPGIFGTQFVVLTALPQDDDRHHNIQIIHRSGYTQPEIHANKWDIYVILDGSGTALLGGERVNDDGRPQEEQRPQLRGAREFQVTEGDMVHVPARVWHQLLTDPGESITYALINVIE